MMELWVCVAYYHYIKTQLKLWDYYINVENIESAHHYTDSDVKTAAAAANAGTCLEDSVSQNNIFSNVGNAVKAVSYLYVAWALSAQARPNEAYTNCQDCTLTSEVTCTLSSYYHIWLMQGMVSEDTVKDCASRLFMVRMKLGEFDPPEMNPYKK